MIRSKTADNDAVEQYATSPDETGCTIEHNRQQSEIRLIWVGEEFGATSGTAHNNALIDSIFSNTKQWSRLNAHTWRTIVRTTVSNLKDISNTRTDMGSLPNRLGVIQR
jgi:hypothetical protein